MFLSGFHVNRKTLLYQDFPSEECFNYTNIWKQNIWACGRTLDFHNKLQMHVINVWQKQDSAFKVSIIRK